MRASCGNQVSSDSETDAKCVKYNHHPWHLPANPLGRYTSLYASESRLISQILPSCRCCRPFLIMEGGASNYGKGDHSVEMSANRESSLTGVSSAKRSPWGRIHKGCPLSET